MKRMMSPFTTLSVPSRDGYAPNGDHTQKRAEERYKAGTYVLTLVSPLERPCECKCCVLEDDVGIRLLFFGSSP